MLAILIIKIIPIKATINDPLVYLITIKNKNVYLYIYNYSFYKKLNINRGII